MIKKGSIVRIKHGYGDTIFGMGAYKIVTRITKKGVYGKYINTGCHNREFKIADNIEELLEERIATIKMAGERINFLRVGPVYLFYEKISQQWRNAHTAHPTIIRFYYNNHGRAEYIYARSKSIAKVVHKGILSVKVEIEYYL